MHIRTHSWGKANLSWSTVQEQLLRAAVNLGHKTLFVSTNGYEGMEDWTEEKSNQIIAEDTANSVVYDIDVTYTIPVNFKQRFLKDSRVKIGKYDYESSPLPEHLHRYLKDCDYVAGSSEFVCELFRKAGAGDSRVIRIPNGVDLKKFNKSIPKINLEKLGIKDKFVFLAVAEPHYRKQLDKLCEVYCETFKGKTDVCLLLKTRVADINVGFEQDIRPVLSSLLLKYGNQMPQIKLITTKIKDLASLYNACDAFVLPTVGEGWGMPFLEALACEKIVIAPNYGGQLDFLNEQNSLLCPVKISEAMSREQYATMRIDNLTKNDILTNNAHRGFVGRPDLKSFGELMEYAKNHREQILEQKKQAMQLTSEKFTWENAVKEMTRRFE